MDGLVGVDGEMVSLGLGRWDIKDNWREKNEKESSEDAMSKRHASLL